MKPHRPLSRLAWGALLGLGLVAVTGCGPRVSDFRNGAVTPVLRPPRLHPDYTGLVIPPNIAPLDFRIDEPGTAYGVRILGERGPAIELALPSSTVRIPAVAWRPLLTNNAGASLSVEVFARDERGAWRRFTPVVHQVATDPIDRTLVYRFLKPLYNYYAELGIYQRDLEGFAVKPVLENRDFGGRCLNCHTCLNRHPEQFALHIRGVSGAQPMLLARSNEVTRINQTAGYISWHPSGELIAYSVNQLSLFFHTIGETRDVFDAESNLGVYWVSSNVVANPPPIAKPERLETWPSWSPDGRHLYFCSAPKLRRERHRQVRYDLMRVSFDLARNAWGEPELMLSADATGLSAAQPRVSPDGRWLLFCLAKYGHFPVYQPNSDLYLMDLTTRLFHRLDINSDEADSWHGWSSNGRWVVFSSKRGNGLFARPHFSHVDAMGQFSKPFVLPQADPDFYDACVQTFNVPEFVMGPVEISPAQLARAVVAPRRVLTPAGATNQVHREEQNAALPAAESMATPPPRR